MMKIINIRGLRAIPAALTVALAFAGMPAHAQLSIGAAGTTGSRVGVGIGAGTANAGIAAGASTSANGGTSGGLNGGIETGTNVTGSNYKGPAAVRGSSGVGASTSARTSGIADNTDAAVNGNVNGAVSRTKSTASKDAITKKRMARKAARAARSNGGAAASVNARGEVTSPSR
jgi:hypothetical protein